MLKPTFFSKIALENVAYKMQEASCLEAAAEIIMGSQARNIDNFQSYNLSHNTHHPPT